MSALWSALLESYPLATTSAGSALTDLVTEATATTIVSPLASHGILTVSGPDASKFLQGQTSADFREVSDSQSRLGCYVNLKGRAITTFRAIQQGEAIHLVMAASLLPLVKEKLGKFIVFSKAQLQINTSIALIGVAGDQATAAVATLLTRVPAEVDDVSQDNGICAVRLSGDQRLLLLVPADRLAAVWEALCARAMASGENAWCLRQMAAGVAEVSLASSELFQPQELNYQLLKGVSYSKGCYTGQEIVARLHFRGKLKQHVQRFQVSSDALPPPGTLVYEDTGKATGSVVLAAQRDSATQELLVIARPGQAVGLHLGEAGGPLLRALSLPYEVPSTE